MAEFICETCGKEFENARAFNGHMGFHKARGQYHCPECGQVFDLPHLLGTHRLHKHGVLGTAKKNVQKQRRKRVRVQKEVAPVSLAPSVDDLGDQIINSVLESGIFQEPPAKNGGDPIEKEIREAFAPLILRYKLLQDRQKLLTGELEQIDRDLGELWKVLGVVPLALDQVVLPPPQALGVQVAFSKKVSDSLRVRGEEWLSLRKNSFTIADMARGISSAPSTTGNLVSDLRAEGKIRLVGKRGHAKTYLSTIGAR